MDNNHKFYKTRDIQTIKELLVSDAKLYGKRPAFLVKEKKGGPYVKISHEELLEDVNGFGTKLLDLGLGNSKVAIVGGNSYEWMLSYFAVTCGAGIVVPIDKELTRDEIMNLINTAGCDGVIYANSYASYFSDENIKIKINMSNVDNFPKELSLPKLVEDGKRLIVEGFREYIDSVIDPYEMKIILFTSGTTDSAKGVMLCHNNIVSNIIATSKIVKLFPNDRTLSILPIHHTFECTLGIMTPLYSGASIAFCEGLKYITKNFEEAKVTMFVAVPLIFESIYAKIVKSAKKSGKFEKMNKAIAINRKLKKINIDLSRKLFKEIHASLGGHMRIFVTGAAAIDSSVIRGFEDLGIRVVQGLGLTECSPLVTGTPDFVDTFKKAGSVGLPIPGTEVKIINKQEDGIGEIICKGPGIMMGYFENPELTSSVIIDGWFHTGDLGYFDEDGFLFMAGRQKNVIVTKNGKNVYPEEIEFYINKSDYVQESMVLGVHDLTSDDTLVGIQIYPNYELFEEEFGSDVTEETIFEVLKKIIDEFNEKMPIYKRIRNITIKRDEFIKTTTKKIKRQANTIL